jgi:hypothetical protein
MTGNHTNIWVFQHYLLLRFSEVTVTVKESMQDEENMVRKYAQDARTGRGEQSDIIEAYGLQVELSPSAAQGDHPYLQSLLPFEWMQRYR